MKQFEDIKLVLLENGFTEASIQNDIVSDFPFHLGGKIRIYKSGAVVFQGKVDIKKNLEEIWHEKCQFAVANNEIINAPNLTFAYFIPETKKIGLKKQIDDYIIENEYKSNPKKDPNAQFTYTINDDQNNKLSLTMYKTNKLVFRGKQTDLWENFTEYISSMLDMSVNTMVANIIHNETYAKVVSQDEIEIIDVVTSKDKDEAEAFIKRRLGDSYEFLYENDCYRIESSEVLLLLNPPVKDYFGCVSGTLEALEGFTKKLVIEIGAFSEAEIMRKGPERWSFQKVYNAKSDTLSDEVLNALSSNTQEKEKQMDILIALIKTISKYRNVHFHSGPPSGGTPISTLEKAQEMHNEVVSLIKKAYENLKVVIEV